MPTNILKYLPKVATKTASILLAIIIFFACPLASCGDESNPAHISLREFLDYDVFPLDNAVGGEKYSSTLTDYNSYPFKEIRIITHNKYEIERVNENTGKVFRTLGRGEDDSLSFFETKEFCLIQVIDKKVYGIFAEDDPEIDKFSIDTFLIYDFNLFNNSQFPQTCYGNSNTITPSDVSIDSIRMGNELFKRYKLTAYDTQNGEELFGDTGVEKIGSIGDFLRPKSCISISGSHSILTNFEFYYKGRLVYDQKTMGGLKG